MTRDQKKLGIVIKSRDYLGETPIWCAEEEALYWINCENKPRVSRFHCVSGTRVDWAMPERVGGLVLKEGGGALVVLARGIYDFDFETRDLRLRVKSRLPEHISLHETQCDRDGRLWVGSINHRMRDTPELPGGGMLFRLDGDRLVPEVEGINCANGLAFSLDGTRLYLSDSPKSVIEAWTLDRSSGRLSERRTFARIADGDGFVDGATVDSQGYYWATLVYGAAIRRYAPDGSLDRQIDLPFANPTKLAFGGADLRDVFLTSTQMVRKGGAPNLGQAMLGRIFSFRSETAGVLDPKWRAH